MNYENVCDKFLSGKIYIPMIYSYWNQQLKTNKKEVQTCSNRKRKTEKTKSLRHISLTLGYAALLSYFILVKEILKNISNSHKRMFANVDKNNKENHVNTVALVC